MSMQGCFIGAETLSKLTNLDAVKQQLWGLQLLSSAAPGDLIMGMSRMSACNCCGCMAAACYNILSLLNAARPRIGSRQGYTSMRGRNDSADGEEKCGKITSSTSLPNGHHVALGYIRCRSRGVQVDLAGKQVLFRIMLLSWLPVGLNMCCWQLSSYYCQIMMAYGSLEFLRHLCLPI